MRTPDELEQYEHDIRTQSAALTAQLLTIDDDDIGHQLIHAIHYMDPSVAATTLASMAGIVLDLLNAAKLTPTERLEFIAQRVDVITGAND